MRVFLCPACGRGKIFHGLLTINDQCSGCGLRFGAREQGDGPAFFAILIVGALTAVSAAIVEIKFEPPFWLHAILWIPMVVVGSIVSLRFLKAALIRVQYRIRPEDFTGQGGT